MSEEKANMAQGASRKNRGAIPILVWLISSHAAAELAVVSQSIRSSTSCCLHDKATDLKVANCKTTH